MNRIDLIVSLTKGYDTVLDIGTDHGLVLKKALDLGYIKKGIASDINKEPLNQAKENLSSYPVSFYLSDGFKNIDVPYDLAVITGMGPNLISNILKEAKLDVDYILGANDKVYILRKWLLENNFNIIEETVSFDRFFYIFIRVRKGKMNLTESEIYTGKYLYKSPLAKKYYEHKLKHYNPLLNIKNQNRQKELKLIKSYFENILKSPYFK